MSLLKKDGADIAVGFAAIHEFQRLMGIQGDVPTLEAPEMAASYPGSFHALLQALPAAIYTTDATGRITFFNEAAASLWGHRPQLGSDAWCGSWKLYWPDGTFLPHGECPMAMALKEGRAIHGMEAAAERPDGTRVPFLAFPTPFLSESGDVIGAVNMLIDITEWKTTELATQRLAAIVESSDDAIISKDLNGIIKSWNRAAERLFGYREEEVVGKPINLLIPADRQNEEPEILAKIRRGERIEHYETVRQSKDGSLVDISLTISPIIGPNGRVVGASKIARDIGERKAAERLTDVIVAEMKHRVKNSLALAASISNQTFHSAPDGEREEYVSRLKALGNAHEALSRKSWEGACLREIVARALEPHQNGSIQINGPDVSINAGKAVVLSLALHELATNAAKYGALSIPEGSVEVEWVGLGERPDTIKLSWRERGGPRVEPPARKGFGSRLIERGLGAEFEAVHLDFLAEGVECGVVFQGGKNDDWRSTSASAT